VLNGQSDERALDDRQIAVVVNPGGAAGEPMM
jgi:hypothetical protein